MIKRKHLGIQSRKTLPSQTREPASPNSAAPKPSNKIPHRSESGFTLVELMVAVFLLSVGMLGLAQMFTVANRHTINSRREAVANSLAQEIREKIMSETFGDVESIFDSIDTDNGAMIPVPAEIWADHVVERLGAGARGRVDVYNPTERTSLQDGMLAVVITMTWDESGRVIDMPLEFLLARIGA